MDNKNKKLFVLILLVALFLSATITAGCTWNSGKDPGQSPTAGPATNQQQEETPDNQVPESVTTAPGQKFSDPVKLPGPTTRNNAIRPKYDSETEEKIIGEAKSEILRVFPGVVSASLNNYHWDSNRVGTLFLPVIVFDGVIVDEDQAGDRCEITYDPENKRIVYWGYDNDAPVRDTSGGEIIRHEDIDIEEDIIPLFKRIIGEEEYEKNKDNYFIHTADSPNDHLTTIAYISESYKGIQSYMGRAQIYLNRANGEIYVYGDDFNDKDFYNEAVTLSTVPGISLDEAKSILETKLDEAYPDDPQEVQYKEAENTNCLKWLDAEAYMDIEDGYLLSPIPLAWWISYTSKGSRAETDRYLGAAVDANTGEILSMHDPRFDIHGKNYD
jgi:hypothetical protein